MAGWLEQRQAYVDIHRQEFADVLREQSRVVQSMWQQSSQPVASVALIFDRGRWDDALADAVTRAMRATAGEYGAQLAMELRSTFDPGQVDGFCIASGRITAENVNAATEDVLQAALALPDDDREAVIKGTFATLLGRRLDALASSTVTTAASLGRATAGEQAGRERKRWRVHSDNSRHADLDGETVDTAETFSNGLRWPGDPRGDAAELTNCQCSVEFP